MTFHFQMDTNEQEEAMSYLPDLRDSPLVTDFDLNGPKESQQEAPTIINERTRFPKTSKPSSYNGTIN